MTTTMTSTSLRSYGTDQCIQGATTDNEKRTTGATIRSRQRKGQRMIMLQREKRKSRHFIQISMMRIMKMTAMIVGVPSFFFRALFMGSIIETTTKTMGSITLGVVVEAVAAAAAASSSSSAAAPAAPTRKTTTRTTSPATTFSLPAVDAATLRSLGVSEAQIRSIMQQEVDDDDDEEVEEDADIVQGNEDETFPPASKRMYHEEDDEYEYETYDDDDVDSEIEPIMEEGYIDNTDDDNEEEGIVSKPPEITSSPLSRSATIMEDENNDQWRSKKEWWRDPLAHFEDRQQQEEEEEGRETRVDDADERLPKGSNTDLIAEGMILMEDSQDEETKKEESFESATETTKRIFEQKIEEEEEEDDDESNHEELNESDNEQLPDETRRRLAEKFIVPRRDLKNTKNGGGNNKNGLWQWTRSSVSSTKGLAFPSASTTTTTTSSSTTTTQPRTGRTGGGERVRNRGAASFAAPAIPALLLPSIVPRVGKAIASSSPAVRVLVSYAVYKLVLTYMKSKTSDRKMEEEEKLSDINAMETTATEAIDDDNDVIKQEEEEIKGRINLGFGRSIVRPVTTQHRVGREGIDVEHDAKVTPSNMGVGYDEQQQQQQPRERNIWSRMNQSAVMGRIRRGFRMDRLVAEKGSLGRRRDHHRQEGMNGNGDDKRLKKRITIQELEDELDALRERAESAEIERDAMQREYEISNKQLQDVRTQMNSLASTTKYLKLQLRDNQQTLERAIQHERQKANEELARVREGMVTVLERERRLMRAQMMRQLAPVRALVTEEDFDDNDDVEEDEETEEEGVPLHEEEDETDEVED